jgi:flavodoxin I
MFDLSKVAVVYASVTGNTEAMAEMVAVGVRNAGAECDVHLVDGLSPDLLLDYDAFLFGTYTWGEDGDVPDEVEDFLGDMEGVEDLAGTLCACFGTGDHDYEYFCGAVDKVEKRLEAMDIALVQDNLKVENEPGSEEEEQCHAFGENFVKRIEA